MARLIDNKGYLRELTAVKEIVQEEVEEFAELYGKAQGDDGLCLAAAKRWGKQRDLATTERWGNDDQPA